MTVVPNSRSLILRSASIILFQIEATRPAGTPNQTDVGVVLLDIVKGPLEQRAGDRVRLLVTQHPPNPETAPVGVWTPIKLAPGLKLFAFSRGKTNQAAMALTDPLCERLVHAEDALPDVTFARDAEAANLTPSAILAQARQRAGILGFLGAQYVAATLMNRALPDPATFDQLMRLVEAPELAEPASDLLAEEVAVKIADSDQPDIAIVQRAVIGLFHIAELKQAGTCAQDFRDLSSTGSASRIRQSAESTGGLPATGCRPGSRAECFAGAQKRTRRSPAPDLDQRTLASVLQGRVRSLCVHRPSSTVRRSARGSSSSSTLNTPLVHPKPTSFERYPYRTSPRMSAARRSTSYFSRIVPVRRNS